MKTGLQKTPIKSQHFPPYVAAGLRPVRVTLWMNIFLFSSPESTKTVASPLALISKSRPPWRPYSTLLSVLLKVVQVTTIEPGTPVKKSSVTVHIQELDLKENLVSLTDTFEKFKRGLWKCLLYKFGPFVLSSAKTCNTTWQLDRYLYNQEERNNHIKYNSKYSYWLNFFNTLQPQASMYSIWDFMRWPTLKTECNC